MRVLNSNVEGVVERVVDSRFGPLVILKNHSTDLAWSITRVTIIEE